MCYNASVYFSGRQVQQQFHAGTTLHALFPPNYLVSVHRTEGAALPVLTSEGPELQPMLWGLVPSWNKSYDPTWRMRMANARVESLEESRAWKGPFSYRRGIAVCDAFYEWRHEGKNKVPFRIQPADGSLLAFGSIWTYNGVLDVYSVSVVTVPANGLMGFIHNTKQRMPLCLRGEDQYETWIRGTKTEALELARPAPEGYLEAWTIGKWIGKATTAPEDTACIKPEVWPGVPTHLT